MLYPVGIQIQEKTALGFTLASSPMLNLFTLMARWEHGSDKG